ncbi:DUF2007 domain-containing protein [Thermotoga sp.]|uniref:putative signal transducing protein n=1 Tax=Thermotoga sp. TaxID=28240 RepID=UPI0025FBCDF0|nr:DUF2007 domain-containing protein [Thermotoga sp.]MCD6550989.1 DUF2007 domain-containing protein [Thermotoga sp.]
MEWEILIEGNELEIRMVEDLLKECGIPYIIETCDDVTPRAIFGSSALVQIKVPKNLLEEAKKVLEGIQG